MNESEQYYEVQWDITEEDISKHEEKILMWLNKDVKIFFNEIDGSVVDISYNEDLSALYPFIKVLVNNVRNLLENRNFKDYKVLYSVESKQYVLVHSPDKKILIDTQKIFEIPFVDRLDEDVDFTVIQHAGQDEWIFKLHPTLIQSLNIDYFLNSFIEIYVNKGENLIKTIRVPYRNLIELGSHGEPFSDLDRNKFDLQLYVKKQFVSYQHIIKHE